MFARAYFVGILAALTLFGCGRPAEVAPPKFVEPPPQEPFVEPTPLPGTDPEPSDIVIASLPVVEPTPLPVPEKSVKLIAGPPLVALTPAGRALIYEFEVGGRSGYSPRPEAPDARFSGITWGIGYDGHQNAPKVIVEDWKALGARSAQRLADTHPFVGSSAQAHLSQVRDILVAWQAAADVFERIDVAREFAQARRAYGKSFDTLRPNCQAALISNGFNRGYSFIGENRSEMRSIRDSVPQGDYAKMAGYMRASARVWEGTEIYRGMLRRRLAEAKLIETP